MTTMTLKKVGDDIRARLKAAERDHQLPGIQPAGTGGDGWVRYDVRVSNAKAGPKVNITINGYEWLILLYARKWGGLAAKGKSFTPPEELADVAKDVFAQWKASEGQKLIAQVDQIAGRDRFRATDGSPGIGGETKFGICIISARATKVTHVDRFGNETVEEIA